MGNRKTHFTIGNFYHCYGRGIDKCETFTDEADYWKFLGNLHIANRRTKLSRKTLQNLTQNSVWKLPNDSPLVCIVAYCLMPNHFHLVIQETTKNGISTFMQRVLTGYTMYFNTKYDRTGGLFTRPFRSKIVDDERYLHDLIEYVHFNPFELLHTTGKREKKHDTDIQLQNYKFSSFPDYQGQHRPQCVLIGKVSPCI